jgi:coproporphyrinogen III oxidase-like Fe-S oxidoreductase
LAALQADIEQALPDVWGRQVHTVFIGGGTPSLLSASAIDRLMGMLRAHFNLWPDAEVTLEANPGAAEAGRFKSYAESGINRISLGIQTFDDVQLQKLGRVHNGTQARNAIDMAKAAVERVNLDLMFALPGQSFEACMLDAREALSYGTEQKIVTRADLPFEFMLNALRLREGVAQDLFYERTGLSVGDIAKRLALARQKKLLTLDPSRLQATETGWRFLNELQSIFL